MTQLHIRQIRPALEKAFNGVIDLSDLEHYPVDQQQMSFLSRALASFVLSQRAGLEPDSAAIVSFASEKALASDKMGVAATNTRELKGRPARDGGGPQDGQRIACHGHSGGSIARGKGEQQMRRLLVALVLSSVVTGCTKTVIVAAPTATATPSPSVSATASPSPSATVAGWTVEQEEQAATIYANGIKRKYPLETRLAAGRCAIAELQKFYDTFDEWQADHENPSTLDVLGRELKTLGVCESKVGI